MNKKWQEYPRNRKISYRGDHVVIIPESRENSSNNMSLFCDVCHIRFARKEDEKSYQMFECCSSCADTWAYSNSEKWKNGWRPSQEQIKIAVDKRYFVNPELVFE
jgi:hypothetical protein